MSSINDFVHGNIVVQVRREAESSDFALTASYYNYHTDNIDAVAVKIKESEINNLDKYDSLFGKAIRKLLEVKRDSGKGAV